MRERSTRLSALPVAERLARVEAVDESGSDYRAMLTAARACRRCPSMEGRRRVLSAANGSPDAAIMVIAEAPGRLGGDVAGIPLTNDASGRHFTALLAEAGIERSRLFITNAVLCNPRDGSGRNRKPSRLELANCRGWLQVQIGVIGPAVIVTLGATALAALAALEPHDYTLRACCGRPLPWAGLTVFPLYHPSPLTRATRSNAQQVEDYRRLAAYLRARYLLETGPLTRGYDGASDAQPG